MSLAGQNLSVFLQPILVVFIFPVVAKDSIGVKAWILKLVYQGSILVLPVTSVVISKSLYSLWTSIFHL